MVKTRDIPFYASAVEGFVNGLKSQGYDAGKVDTVMIALTGNAKKDRQSIHDHLPGAQLVFAVGTDAACLVSDEQSSVPEVFTMVVDPVHLHLVKSLDNPGGSATGSTLVVNAGKQLDQLQQIAPAMHRIGVLYTAGDPTSIAFIDGARQAAGQLNLQIVALPQAAASTTDSLEQLAKQVDAIWLILDPASAGPTAMADTFAVAREHHLPVLGDSSASVHAGALLALSADVTDLGEETAQMAVPLMAGTATAAQTQVRGPRKTTLSINLVAAEALGLSVPDSVLHLADEVIDK